MKFQEISRSCKHRASAVGSEALMSGDNKHWRCDAHSVPGQQTQTDATWLTAVRHVETDATHDQ